MITKAEMLTQFDWLRAQLVKDMADTDATVHWLTALDDDQWATIEDGLCQANHDLMASRRLKGEASDAAWNAAYARKERLLSRLGTAFGLPDEALWDLSYLYGRAIDEGHDAGPGRGDSL